jgi:uncharacterized UPF0160 family protein
LQQWAVFNLLNQKGLFMSKLVAGTHGGEFHGDDVFGAATLKLAFPEIEFIRTREQVELSRANLRFDVGGVYNGVTDFDHHQKGFCNARENGIKYSSFGLLWKAFSHWICSEEVAEIVDKGLVSTIDAVDNGDPTVTDFGYSDMVSRFNPNWNEVPNYQTAFLNAVDFATTVLLNAIRGAKAYVESKEEIKKAVVLMDGKVVLLPQFCPWQKAVIETYSEALFCLFQDNSEEWRIQTVPVTAGSFESRKKLPNAWAGLRDDELNRLVGISDGVFVHNGLFIAGAKSKDSILKMAELAIADGVISS